MRRDRRLMEGERVVMHAGLHPIVFAGTAGFVTFLALTATLIVRHNDLPARTEWSIALGFAAVAVLSVAAAIVRRRAATFVVTDRRVLLRVGLVRGHEVILPLDQVDGVEVETTVLGRLLGYGTLSIAGRGEAGDSFRHVAQSTALRDAILRVGRHGRRSAP